MTVSLGVGESMMHFLGMEINIHQALEVRVILWDMG